MQQKNLIIFIALCLLTLVGWPLLMNRLWPPRPRAVLPPVGVRVDLLAQLSALPLRFPELTIDPSKVRVR